MSFHLIFSISFRTAPADLLSPFHSLKSPLACHVADHNSASKSNFLHSGKKQKNFQRGRALLRSRKYLDVSVQSSDDDSDCGTPLGGVSRSNSLIVLTLTPEKRGEGEKRGESDGEKCVRSKAEEEGSNKKKQQQHQQQHILSSPPLSRMVLFSDTLSDDVLASPLPLSPSVPLPLSPIPISPPLPSPHYDSTLLLNSAEVNNTPQNNENNENDYFEMTDFDGFTEFSDENSEMKNSFQTPNPKRNSKNGRKNSTVFSSGKQPFSDFKKNLPFSDFLSPDVYRQSESPNPHSNIQDVIFPRIHTDSTMNTYYSNIERNEFKRKTVKIDNSERLNMEGPRGRNNIVNGVLNSGFRYVKRPNWLQNRTVNSPKNESSVRNFDIENLESPRNKNNNRNARKKENVNFMESEKVFAKFMRASSSSPTTERNPCISSKTVKISSSEKKTEIPFTPLRRQECNKITDFQNVENNDIDDKINEIINYNTESTKLLENENFEVEKNENENKNKNENEVKINSVVLLNSPIPSTPRNLGPDTPGHLGPGTPGHLGPSTPGHLGPGTPGRSPFAQSLAIGSLSPRILKTPNSKKKSLPASEQGSEEKVLPLKTPISRKSPFSLMRFSPSNTMKKRYNMGGSHGINSEEHRHQQSITSNEIIADSIYNALFLIEQKSSKDGKENGLFHRIRCWDDESDSEEEEEVVLFNYKDMNTAVVNYTDYLFGLSNSKFGLNNSYNSLNNNNNYYKNNNENNNNNHENKDKSNEDNNNNSKVNKSIQYQTILSIRSCLLALLDDTARQAKAKTKISAVDFSWFKNLIFSTLLRPETEKREIIIIKKSRSKSRSISSTENLLLRKKSLSELNVKDININKNESESKNVDEKINENEKINEGENEKDKENEKTKEKDNKLINKGGVDDNDDGTNNDFAIINRRDRRGSFDVTNTDRNSPNLEQKSKSVNTSESVNTSNTIIRNNSSELNLNLKQTIIKRRYSNSNSEKRTRSVSLTENPPPIFPPPNFENFISSSSSSSLSNYSPTISPQKVLQRTFLRKSRGESMGDEITMLDTFPFLPESPKKDILNINNSNEMNNNGELNTTNNNNNDYDSNNYNNDDNNNNINDQIILNNSKTTTVTTSLQPSSTSTSTSLSTSSTTSNQHIINPIKSTLNSNSKLLLSPEGEKNIEKQQSSPLFQNFSLPSNSEILSKYITPSFVSSLIHELNYEDDRFTSLRVTVLISLYKNCNTEISRKTLINGILECSFDRFDRCAQASRFSYNTEFDTNLIASRGLLGLDLNSKNKDTNTKNNICDNNSNKCYNIDNRINNRMNDNINKIKSHTHNTTHTNNTNTLSAISLSCNIFGGKIENKERPPITHRDHDLSVMEIISFITSAMLNDVLNFVHEFSGDLCGESNRAQNICKNVNIDNHNKNNSEGVHNNNNENYNNNDNTNNNNDKKENTISMIQLSAKQLEANLNTCIVVERSLFNVLRCYGSMLG